MRRLEGQVALVTGAGRHGGLGEAICLHLGEQGARIVVSDLATPTVNLPANHIGTQSELDSVVTRLCAQGVEAIACVLDVRDESQVQHAIETAVERFGRLDILVNNAGIGYLMEPLLEMSKDRWQTVLDVNLMGVFLCTKYAAKQMIAQGRGGRVVNIASVAAKLGSMHLAAYAASKHGMIGLTRSAAIELGPHRITVNAICPNHVTTGLGSVQNEYRARQNNQSVEQYLIEMRSRIPLGRVGLAADTAKACVFLCSDEACYITAEAMNVSGGQETH